MRGIGFIAATTALWAMGPAPATAQATGTADADAKSADAEPSGFDEIIVTARRRAENLQNVPIAITAMTADRLDQQQIRTVTDLERSVPGFNICCGRGSASFLWIRGIPGVIGYFGEAPVTLSGSALFFDISGAQVLKGPQGTLFGLSTNGGAVLYAPVKPSSTLGGSVQATVGNYGRRAIEAIVNLPMVEDKILLRLGVANSHIDGYIYDPTQREHLEDENYSILRASLTVKPTENLDNTLLVNSYRSHSNGSASPLVDVNPTGFAAFVFGADTLQNLLDQQIALGKYEIPGTSLPGGTFFRMQQLNIVNTTVWEIGDTLTLKNILGHQRLKQFGASDSDATPLPIIDIGIGPSQSSGPTVMTSEELQLQGRAFDGRLVYTLGTFHSWTKDLDPAISYNNILGGISGSLSRTSATTHAIFAHGAYDLGRLLPGLSFSAGLRYTWDKRSSLSESYDGNGTRTSSASGRGSFEAASHLLSLTWQPRRDVMLYLSKSKGYSSGGINLGPFLPAGKETFEPESLDNYEAGIKADWSIGSVRLRTNLSAFYGKYSDIQVYLIVPAAPGAPPPGTVLIRENAARGHIQGLDGEITMAPTDWLELGANGTLIDPQYDDYIVDGEDRSVRPFVFVSKRKYNVRATVHLTRDDPIGDIGITVDYTYQSKVNGNANKQVPIKQDFLPGFGNMNANLNWSRIGGIETLSGSLFVNNVTNQKLASGRAATYDTIGTLGFAVAQPRMFGLRLKYSFD